MIFAILSLTACGEGLMSTLGFDTHDYFGEKVITVHETDSEIARQLADMTRTLTVNSPILTPFSGAKEAADACRDAVLGQMLGEDYARYAGNGVMLQKAEEAYPGMQISVLIPADDFESVIYATFGGSEKITNKNGALFSYLDRVRAYTTAMPPVESDVVTTVLSCEETARTYRIRFVNTLDGVTSPAYFALLIKREDGSLYFSALSEVAD
ncbi:MAG: hypothetical protein J6S41_07740 [Clostridia bacterium]|nr:hypothetical protein [Clostridia bacterium]